MERYNKEPIMGRKGEHKEDKGEEHKEEKGDEDREETIGGTKGKKDRKRT